MVREISATALNKLATRLGNEPIAIIGVCWINEDPPPITADTPLAILNYNRGWGPWARSTSTRRRIPWIARPIRPRERRRRLRPGVPGRTLLRRRPGA